MIDQYLQHLSWIDDHHDAMVHQLEQWIAIHSGSDNLDGLETMHTMLKKAFASLDGEMDSVTLPQQQCLTFEGKFEERPLGQALSIRKHPTAPIQIFLCGHMDIALSKNDPLGTSKIVNHQKLIGRGSVDMKGGLVILLNALKALEMSPFAGKIGWQVWISPDEEIGSPGSQQYLLDAGKKFHLGLIFEPSLPDGTLVSARKGSANFTLAIRGKSAHAGREFHLGKNAICSAARFILSAESLSDPTDDITVNIGYIHGGGPVNVVPDKAFCRLNVRVKKEKDLQKIKDKLAKIVEIENHQQKVHLTLHQDSERPPKVFDKKMRSIFESLQTCAMHLGVNIDWKPSGGVCDGNTLASTGLKTIDTLGAVGGNLHTEKEYVILRSLTERAKLTARFLMQIAAGEVTIK